MTASLLTIVLITALTQIGGVLGGLLLIWKARWTNQLSTLLLSFAAGTLLGVAFLDLLPEAAKESGGGAAFRFALLGILVFFLFEKMLLWHHHAHDGEDGTTDEAALVERHLDAPAVRGKRIRPLILLGDGLHNALDGATIAIAFSSDWRLGLFTALAVFLHEVPHNISDFAVLLHTGMPRSRVFWWNILLALPSPFAALLTLLVLQRVAGLFPPLLAVAGGSFIYIALANLMPEIHHERRPWRIVAQTALFAVGVALVWQLGLLFPEG